MNGSRPNHGLFLPVGRRQLLAAGIAGLMVVSLPRQVLARPSLQEAIRTFTGGADAQDGRVRLELPPLVENGNAVGITVNAESPMTADNHVRRIGIFNEKNPEANVIVFHLGPRSGRAQVSTRIRLATSQVVVAVAEMSDGSFWSSRASAIVTLAACIEDLS
ncbi:SoxY-related AACIE arm protein [Mesorhizobium sp. YC-39]|uniref:SoxY-related AACIE arm protein n=1 Tax=unclassified Mesorhizobium TaxID=325217 RepID=UPI0021E88EDB|nr:MULTISPECIES: SoxY-related AACIE arm protein [unclassified Mesorhizobium]MCV3207367.1 SoxY-related AACIE arm protein [Mesorhizobium sp. YC-2]MCV3229094.1 SoxY-related AACIE arm protein [Mesorhizobium sp. YC-39]